MHQLTTMISIIAALRSTILAKPTGTTIPDPLSDPLPAPRQVGSGAASNINITLYSDTNCATKTVTHSVLYSSNSKLRPPPPSLTAV